MRWSFTGFAGKLPSSYRYVCFHFPPLRSLHTGYKKFTKVRKGNFRRIFNSKSIFHRFMIKCLSLLWFLPSIIRAFFNTMNQNVKPFIIRFVHYSCSLLVSFGFIQGLGEKIFQGVRRSLSGPQILLGPPSPKPYQGPMPLNHFLSDRCRSSFKSEGITVYHIQLGPMKNTTRHKIGLNPARGSGGAL